MKLLGVLFVVAIAICFGNSEAQSHNVTFGAVGPWDYRVHHQYVIKKFKPLQIVSEELTYPPKGVTANQIISGIRITDQYVNGKGGYATLNGGGPGSTTATLRFKSQRGHGYNFIVEVFVRK